MIIFVFALKIISRFKCHAVFACWILLSSYSLFFNILIILGILFFHSFSCKLNYSTPIQQHIQFSCVNCYYWIKFFPFQTIWFWLCVRVLCYFKFVESISMWMKLTTLPQVTLNNSSLNYTFHNDFRLFFFSLVLCFVTFHASKFSFEIIRKPAWKFIILLKAIIKSLNELICFVVLVSCWIEVAKK